MMVHDCCKMNYDGLLAMVCMLECSFMQLAMLLSLMSFVAYWWIDGLLQCLVMPCFMS